MSNWKDVILSYYQVLQIAVAISKAFTKIKKAFPKEYDVTEIKENLSSGELHFGDKIKTIGTFSEYLPFIDPKFILTKTPFQLSLPRTARLQAISDVYCGALFKLEQRDAFAKEVMPIFYGIDSKVLEHYTGEMLELQCQIIQVPAQYRDIINQNSYFTFEKEKGLSIPFGLKVLAVEPYGLVDSFKINAWLIGNLNPAPQFNSGSLCDTCSNYFAYMQIDPITSLLKYGCTQYDREGKFDEDFWRDSEEFSTLEKQGKPYVVFPEVFRHFEVFYPFVDIFDETQKNRSKNVLLGAIEENMERMFKNDPNLQEDVTYPKEFILEVDFQFDQLNKLTSQTFDSSNVPKWQCPQWVPDPKKIKEDTTENEKAKTRFKLKKAF